MSLSLPFCSVMRLIHDWLRNEYVILGEDVLTDMINFISTNTDNNDYPADGVVLQIVPGIQVKVCVMYTSY